MNDKELERLLWMACEIDEIEQLAGKRADPEAGAPARAPADDDIVIRIGRGGLGRRGWRAALSIGAVAAAACLWFFLRLPAEQSSVQQASALPLQVAYCPGVPFTDGQRIDRFEPNSPEYCVVLAIFRTWQQGCRCLVWQLHEWEDGRTLAELMPGDVPDIELDVTDAPPVEQLLVVAISPRASDLPSSDDEVDGLLQCLNELSPPTESCESAEVCAMAVESCLPEGVTVVPQSFFVE